MITIIQNWVHKIAIKRSRSFWIAFTLLIITALSMRPSSSCLLTPATPRAIVDLELAFDQATAISIKELWTTHHCGGRLSLSSNGKEAALINIILDFVFIAAYTWFFIVIVVLTQIRDATEVGKLTMMGCFAALAAGMLDVIENIFMLIFLTTTEINSLWFAIPAAIKFVTLGLLVIFILFRIIARLFLKRAN